MMEGDNMDIRKKYTITKLNQHDKKVLNQYTRLFSNTMDYNNILENIPIYDNEVQKDQ
jgi:hypothetical protein